MNTSPIAITVYNRKDHFLKTIESLAANPLADQTDLYVAIDAPYRNEDISINKSIVSVSKLIRGFKSVEVIVRDENVGALRNANLLRSEVLSKHDSYIRTEDDNVFSPYFLRYVNDGLNKYKFNEKIFAICGYLEPVNRAFECSTDTFLRPGFTSNGFGTWKDRLTSCDLTAANFLNSYLDPRDFLRFSNLFGYHVVSGLIYSKMKNLVFQDYGICHGMFQRDQKCVFPVKTLVRNIGQDGSGIHSGINLMLQNQEIWDLSEKIVHATNNDVDKKMNKLICKYHYRNNAYLLYRYFQYLYVKLSFS